MLYEDDMPLIYDKIVPLRGRIPKPLPKTNARAAYTDEELEAVAPELSEAQWAVIRANTTDIPEGRAKELLKQRIEAAHELKAKKMRGEA